MLYYQTHAGATYAADEEVWLWVDGSIVDLQNFNKDNFVEPTVNYNCVAYEPFGDLFSNIDCSHTDFVSDYICEFDL